MAIKQPIFHQRFTTENSIQGALITPIFDQNFDDFSSDAKTGSLFLYDFSDADKKLFSSFIPVFRRQLDVVVSITDEFGHLIVDEFEDEYGNRDFIDPEKTKLLFYKDGTFAIYNEDFEKLSKDQNAFVSLQYLLAPNSIVNEFSFQIIGTNESPIIEDEPDFELDEDTVILGQFVADDIDFDDDPGSLTYQLVSPVSPDIIPGFSFNADGSYSIDASVQAYQHLPVGGDEERQFTWQATDKHGALSGTDDVTITINGVNDNPTVEDSLYSILNEQDLPDSIDLLEGADDVDDGAVLNAISVSEAGSQTGWSFDALSDTIVVDPDYFDALYAGETGQWVFNYQVSDEHDATVDQTLTVDVEGFNDPPFLEVVIEPGNNVNEVVLKITGKPHLAGERVQLRFDNLHSNARVLNASDVEVTAGIANFYVDYDGEHNFTVVMDGDVFQPVDVTAASYKASDDTFIAETVHSVDLLYDTNTENQDIYFRNSNQNMWSNTFDGYFGWHEYFPILGEDYLQWNEKAWNEETSEHGIWEDKSADFENGIYWTSGDEPIEIVNIEVTEDGFREDALAGFKLARDTALTILNGAKYALDKAQEIREEIDDYLETDQIETDWDNAKNKLNELTADRDTAADAIGDLVYGAAYTIANPLGLCHVCGDEAGKFAENLWNSAYDVSSAILDIIDPSGLLWSAFTTARDALTSFVEGGYQVAKSAYDAIEESATSILNGLTSMAHNLSTAVEDLTGLDIPDKMQPETWDNFIATIKEGVEEAVEGSYLFLYNAAENAYTLATAAIDKVDLSGKLQVLADLFARVGLQLDFVIDVGSVDTDVGYELKSINQYNQTTDMLAITPTLHNLANDSFVPFSTISPNASIRAALLYDVGANLDFFIDGKLVTDALVIEDIEVFPETTWFDLSPDSEGWQFSPTIGTNGMNFMFDIDDQGNLVYIEYDERKSFSEMFDIDLGADPGELVILDLSSKDDLPEIEVPFVENLTDGIIEEIKLKFPTIETDGKLMSEDELITTIQDSYSYKIKKALADTDPAFAPLLPDLNNMTFGEKIDDHFFSEAVEEWGDLFEVVNLEQLTSAFENATITFAQDITDALNRSQEFINKYGDINSFVTEQELATIIREVGLAVAGDLLHKVLDIADGSYDTGPIVMVDLTNRDSEALLHANLWNFDTDKFFMNPVTWLEDSWNELMDGDEQNFVYQNDITENTADLGLYVSSGESDPFFSLTVDVDQLATVIVVEILKKVATGASAGLAAALNLIPNELLNPVDSTLSLETILKLAEVPKTTQDEIKKYLEISFTQTQMDVDVTASADFSQDFTLTVDDMSYLLTLEDGTQFDFLASEADQFVLESASDYDVTGGGVDGDEPDGLVSYDLELVPTAMFSNDTELGLNIGLSLEFLKAALEAKFKLPLGDILGGEEPSPLWPTIPLPMADYTLGPLLQVDWEMNALDIDVYESRFQMDIGEVALEDNAIDIDLVGIAPLDMAG